MLLFVACSSMALDNFPGISRYAQKKSPKAFWLTRGFLSGSYRALDIVLRHRVQIFFLTFLPFSSMVTL